MKRKSNATGHHDHGGGEEGHGDEEEEHGDEGESYLGHELIDREIENLSDFIQMTRLNSSIDFSDSTTMVIGASALFGPNATGKNSDTRIFGADLYLKWKPLSNVRGWPFVAWQSELMSRKYETPELELEDWGFYSQLIYGFRPRWSFALRGEYADDKDRNSSLQGRHSRLSTNVTFYPSEFSKWRLQYNYDRAENKDDKPIHGVFMQFEFLLGTHGAHQF